MHLRVKGEPNGFTWSDYCDLIIAMRRQLTAHCAENRGNLNGPELADSGANNASGLRSPMLGHSLLGWVMQSPFICLGDGAEAECLQQPSGRLRGSGEVRFRTELGLDAPPG